MADPSIRVWRGLLMLMGVFALGMAFFEAALERAPMVAALAALGLACLIGSRLMGFPPAP